MSAPTKDFTNYGNINITINNNKNVNKRDLSSDSDTSISCCDIKRRRKIYYLHGDGKKEWQLNKELLVNKVDIMKAFKKFRNKSIEEAEKGSELNSLRILHLKSEEKSAVEDLAKELEPKLPRAPAQAILYCKDLIDGVEVEGGEEEEEQDMMKTIKYLSRAIISNKAKISCSSEASFSEKYIMPAIRRVILDKSSDSIIYAIIVLTNSIDKADKYKKKPDIMIGTEFKKKDYYFFFVEIKRPSTQSKYQAEDDYVKLLKEMKGSIDNQLLLGIENPSSLGLLVEGAFSICIYTSRK
ncbi:hypothetical protein PS6_000936 [Mucor atramentarius]